MKFAVMGAGAVGCYYGAMLARAGHAVVLIGRPVHVDAMLADGLRLQTSEFDEFVKVEASVEVSAVKDADVVLFAVKSTDTETSAQLLKPHMKDDALVVTLQNGVDNADRVRKILGSEVAAAVVYVATEMLGPGFVKHNGRGELLIEPSSKSDELAAVLIAAGVPCEISSNVRGSLWAKLILNCAYNALSAISQMPYGPLVQIDGIEAVLSDVVDECMAVAAADEVDVPGDVGAAIVKIGLTMPAQYSSTAQDLARGKPSEIDHLNGFIVARGVALGVPTPANRVLHTLVKVLEHKASLGRPA